MAAALVVAAVVAQAVVAGLAEGGADLAVVVLVADHVVGVAQLALVAGVDVLGPFLSRQLEVGGEAADHVVLVLWRKEEKSRWSESDLGLLCNWTCLSACCSQREFASGMVLDPRY